MLSITDPYLDTSVCVHRLYETWLKHPKLILAVDFDDTVFNFHKREGQTNELVIKAVKEAQSLGFYIVCFTSSKSERFTFIQSYFQTHGITLDAINTNIIETPYGKEGKIFFNLLLDDRAGLGQSLEILNTLIYLIKSHKS